MRRSTHFFIAIAVLGVLAAIAGSLVAIGGGLERDASVPAPIGDDTVLRLEPAGAEVSCGSGAVAVNLYLDDLVTRPSPLNETVSHGIAGFQVIVRYDPAVLRLGPGPDIQLGPQLSTFDQDRDGVTRDFFVVQDVDDYLGRAVIGAGSFVTDTSGPDRKLEEGPDPVARGGPLLLMTINFQTIGQGESALTLSEQEDDLGANLGRPGIIDPSGKFYTPLVLESSSLNVEGGSCPDAPEITPRPSPAPAATELVEPTLEVPTPLFLTPTPAAASGRTDCGESWNAYADPDERFSVCYPAGWSVVTVPARPHFGPVASISSTPPSQGPPSGVLLTLYWTDSSAYYQGVVKDRCYAVSHWSDVREVALDSIGPGVIGCVGDATDYGHPNPGGPAPIRGTSAQIPLDGGKGYIVLFLMEPGTASRVDEQPLLSVLDSLNLAAGLAAPQ